MRPRPCSLVACVLIVGAATGCTPRAVTASKDVAHSASPDSVPTISDWRLRRIEVPGTLPLTIPPGFAIERVYSVSAKIASVRLVDDWLTWGRRDSSTRPITSDPLLRETYLGSPTGIAAVHLGTDRVTDDVMPSGGAMTSVMGGGDGFFLIRTTEPMPATACDPPDQFCQRWRLYVRPFSGGAPALIAAAEHPHTQFMNPMPATGEGRIAWQQYDSKRKRFVMIVARRDGTDQRKIHEASRMASRLSIFGGRVYFDTASGGTSRLQSIPVTGGAPRLEPVPLDVHEPTVAFGAAAYLSGRAGHSIEARVVRLGSSTAQRRGSVLIARADDIYYESWIDERALLMIGPNGLTFVDVTDPGTPRLHPMAPRYDLGSAYSTGGGRIAVGFRDGNLRTTTVYVLKRA